MIPIAQGLVSIYRADDQLVDDYDTPAKYRFMGTVRAVIDSPGGSERNTRAEAETVTAQMISDVPPFGIEHTDIGRDWRGEWWQFSWVQREDGFGLDHLEVGIVRYHGVAPA